MSVFDEKEINYCPLCGARIIENDAVLVADGAVCGVCLDRFRLADGDDDISRMSIRVVRNIIDAEASSTTVKNDDAAEGSDFSAVTVSDDLCPVCGLLLRGKVHRIADAVICQDCERMERSMYYKTYAYWDPDGKELIDVDINDLKKSGHEKDFTVEVKDELNTVTLATVKEDYILFKQRMQDAIRSAPSHASAVAYVDDSFSDGSKTVALVGVAKGSFGEGDEVILVHDGELASADVIIAYSAEGNSYEHYRNGVVSSTLSSGEFGWLVFKDIEPVYSLTDIIYIL